MLLILPLSRKQAPPIIRHNKQIPGPFAAILRTIPSTQVRPFFHSVPVLANTNPASTGSEQRNKQYPQRQNGGRTLKLKFSQRPQSQYKPSYVKPKYVKPSFTKTSYTKSDALGQQQEVQKSAQSSLFPKTKPGYIKSSAAPSFLESKPYNPQPKVSTTTKTANHKVEDLRAFDYNEKVIDDPGKRGQFGSSESSMYQSAQKFKPLVNRKIQYGSSGEFKRYPSKTRPKEYRKNGRITYQSEIDSKVSQALTKASGKIQKHGSDSIAEENIMKAEPEAIVEHKPKGQLASSKVRSDNVKSTNSLESKSQVEIAQVQSPLEPITKSKYDNLDFEAINKFKLRNYQKECIIKCLEAFDEGKRRIAVSLATGGGKTVIFSNLISFMEPLDSNMQRQKTLILVHRRELAMQALAICQKVMPDKRIDVELGTHHASKIQADVVVASIQSLSTRLADYNPEDFKMIIIDEAHHAAASTYKTILEHFGALTPDSKIGVVGFSATLTRHDGKSLANILDYIVFHKGVDEMISDGWLCDAKFTTIKNDVDLSQVQTRGGDFAVGSLSNVMNNNHTNELIVKTYLKLKPAHGWKSTLLFGVDVAHIKSLCGLFNSNGIHAECITGTTATRKRDDVVQKFKNGEIPVLMNCGVFTEGTDIPNIDSILLARPTKSKGLLMQMIGRGLRQHSNKSFCSIVDFVASGSLVDVASLPTLVGLDASVEIEDATISQMLTLRHQQIEKEKLALVEQTRTMVEKVLPGVFQGNVLIKTFDSLQGYMFDTGDDSGTASGYDKDEQIFHKSHLSWLRKSQDAWGTQLASRGYYVIITRRLKTLDDLMYNVLLEEATDANPTNYEYSATSYIKNIKLPGYRSANIFPWSDDLERIVAAVENRFKEYDYSSFKISMKLSPWRQNLSTPRQKDVVMKQLMHAFDKPSEGAMKVASRKFASSEFLKSELSSNAIAASEMKQLFESRCQQMVDRFNRGLCHDLIFSLQLCRLKYFQNLAALVRKAIVESNKKPDDSQTSSLLHSVTLGKIERTSGTSGK